MNIVDAVLVCFLVLIEVAGQKVGIFIAIAETVAGRNQSLSVGVVVRRLRVPNPLIKEASLDGVIAKDLGQRIRCHS